VKSRHRYLPWSTVYVVLSCEGGEERAGSFLDDQKNVGTSKEIQGKRRSIHEDNENNKRKKRAVGVDEPRSNDSDDESEGEKEDVKCTTSKEKTEEESDDLSHVEKSRTFLIKVDENSCVVKVRINSIVSAASSFFCFKPI